MPRQIDPAVPVYIRDRKSRRDICRHTLELTGTVPEQNIAFFRYINFAVTIQVRPECTNRKLARQTTNRESRFVGGNPKASEERLG